MADKDIGAVLVLEEGNLVGIVTERDYARKLILQGKASKETPVSEVMSRRVLYVEPDQTVEECMALMTEKHLRHLPVINGDQLLGIVSIRDVVKDIISDREFLIEQLEHYITDRRPGIAP
ncbi:MAG: CBS domain-containing protein [Chloroflexales bacterium]|nr:CBS domain-containing protein [Chloroflexales bacterium]